jgi:hypothetical protein
LHLHFPVVVAVAVVAAVAKAVIDDVEQREGISI